MNIDKSPTEIRVELMRNNVRQIDIAKELEVDASVVSRVIDGKITSDRIRRAIAKKIGVDVRFLWPSTYMMKDDPKKRGPVARANR